MQRFWGSPDDRDEAGPESGRLFRAVADGRIKALWIMATNPVGHHAGRRPRRARRSRACPFVVVSDVLAETDTTRARRMCCCPRAAWGEKDGTVTNSERRISRQRAFLPPPGEARPDWRRSAMWRSAWASPRPSPIASQRRSSPNMRALAAVENDGTRDLRSSARLATSTAKRLRRACAVSMAASGRTGSARRRASSPMGASSRRTARRASSATPFRKLASRDERALSIHPQHRPHSRPVAHDDAHRQDARLMAHVSEPFVEIHPADAAAIGVAPADLAEIESAHGRAILRVVVTERQRRGSLFAPMHWTDQHASLARIDALVGAAADPVSGQPELKAAPVAARRFDAAWHAFAASTRPIAVDETDYFAAAVTRGGWRAELAGVEAPHDWTLFARRRLTLGDDADLIAYHDAAAGRRRFVAFRDGVFAGALFAATGPVAIARSWIIDRLGEPVPPTERLRLLTGRPGAEARDRGPIVCACFDVGRNEILEAAAKLGEAVSVAAIGARLKAGSNCGSCRGEIAKLIAPPQLNACARLET